MFCFESRACSSEGTCQEAIPRQQWCFLGPASPEYHCQSTNTSWRNGCSPRTCYWARTSDHVFYPRKVWFGGEYSFVQQYGIEQATSPNTTQPRSVSCGEENNRPLLLLDHIRRHPYEEIMFTNNYDRWHKNLAWIWGTLVGMREHSLVRNCRGRGVNPTESFDKVY